MPKAFITTEKHAGKYVAFKSRSDDTVISAGDDPKEVFDDAKKNGAEKPVIAFIPDKDSVLIY